MIVAVTGSNGFIGRHLCHALQSGGHDVRRIVRADFATNGLERLIDGADAVVHAAAATRAPTVEEFRRANVDLTRRVAEAARSARVRRLIFISSQAAAGPAPSLEQPTSEEDLPCPVEAYGQSKLDAELVVAQCGIDFAVLRPAAVYGPDDRDFATAFALARNGIAIHAGNRDQWISIIHVQDCVRGIELALTSEAARGRVYFLSNDHPIRWLDVYRLAALPRRLRVDLEIPSVLAQAAGKIGDAVARIAGKASLVTTEKLKLARPQYWVCSPARAERELGFCAHIAVEEGIPRAARGILA